jgi:serine/threonine protein kinase
MEVNALNTRRAKSLDNVPKSRCSFQTFILGYDLETVIRKTLQGSVMLMKQANTGRQVAVKVAHKRYVDSGLASNGVRICENVRNEAKLLKALATTPCVNIIQLLDYREEHDKFVLVLELAQGGELFDWVKSHGKVSDTKARTMFRGITRAVSFLHKRNICHLDLSLENVLLTTNSIPKLCDFGLARVFEPGVRFRGDIHARPGKLSYMSPEVYSGADFDGPASDVWSLGIILFIIMFGFPPFEVASRSDVRYDFLMKRGLGALLQEWDLHKQISEDCQDLICKMLQPEYARISLTQVMQHPWMTSHAMSAVAKQ